MVQYIIIVSRSNSKSNRSLVVKWLSLLTLNQPSWVRIPARELTRTFCIFVLGFPYFHSFALGSFLFLQCSPA